MKPRFSPYGLTILLVLLVSSMPLFAVAQDTSTPESTTHTPEVLISIHPKDQEDGTKFAVEIDAGGQTTLTASLTNFGAEPIKLRTYLTDILPSPNGGLKIAAREDARTGSALWIEYPEEEFTLESQQAITRDMVISVPKGTPPGQYVSAAILETVEPIGDATGSFEQYYRKVVSVYVTVPGDVVVDFSFGEPEILVAAGLAGVQFPVTNSGNVRIDLRGEVTLTSSEGTVVHSDEISLGPIYMGQSTVIQVPFAVLPPAGDYTLTYTLSDKDSGVSQTTESVAVVVPEAESTEIAPIAFENVLVEANADPIAFANVSVDVNIAAANYPSTRLSLSVYHNGEHVEDFVLADNLSLSQGVTSVSQRYLPATNWESGEYTFSLKLDSTEGGQTSLLFEEADVATLEVP